MMRTRGFILFVLALIGLFALSLWASDVAFMADALSTPRPTATPEPLPPDYEISAPSSPEALPDLVVEGIRVSPSSPFVNQPATVIVTVKNVGSADVGVGNNTFLDLYINPPTDDLRGIPGDYWWDVQGAQLRVGTSVEYRMILKDVFTDTASYNVYAQVDTPYLPDETFPQGHILEADEDNNVKGPVYVTARTHFTWMQKDHVDFFQNMASTLDVVPVSGTVGIITNTPGLVIDGDSALALGIFDEPPLTGWGSSESTPDYDMMDPDTLINDDTATDQRFPYVHADGDLVVVVWEDGRNGPTYGRDVYLRWSDNEGRTWKPALRVNDDVGYSDQKNPAVAVAPSGDIVVAWQDHRGASFDIYVQAFRVDGTNLIRCDPDVGCPTTCAADCNFRVDTGAQNRDQILPDISVDNDGDFYIAWQDQRNNNDDIFAVRSYYTSTTPCPSAALRETLGFLPESPTEQIAAPDADHLCWGHDARIHDDPSLTKQASPDITALQGVKVKDIEYEIVGDPPELVVTKVITEPVSYVVVVWEDDREGDNDIYLTYSRDGGKTFVRDQRLNDDKPANSSNGFDQLTPAVDMNQWMEWFAFTRQVDGDTLSAQVKVPVATMHVVWQDFRNSSAPTVNDDPDIYYATITARPLETNDSWDLQLVFEGQQKVNDNDQRAWQTGPVWQSDPQVAATSSGVTLEESDSYNAFVTWSDWRNYGGGDFDNVDIYFRLFTTFGTPTEFVGGNNVMVNDNARLHDFDTSSPTYSDYRQDMPPHARQRNPSIASTLIAEWPTIYGGYVYVVWDDDRLLDPFTNRNVYLTRSNMLFGGHRRIWGGPGPGQGERYGSGAFVSRIYDSYSDETQWYTVDWHAATDDGTYITVQTRLGNTPDEVLNSDWYPQGYPYPDDAISKGAPLQGYDAPGQHIVDADGNRCPGDCPVARYIQYRVNFWARDAAAEPDLVVLNTPFLFDVILHYEKPPSFYLPIVAKRYR